MLNLRNIDKRKEGKERMKQIRIGGFICKAKEMPSYMKRFLEKAEEKLEQYKKKSA